MGRSTGLKWGPTHIVHAAPNPAKIIREFSPDASRAVAGLERGGRVVGLTGGVFSLLDLMRATLEITGPARVTVSAWSQGIRDTETAAWLLTERKIESFRLVVDHNWTTLKPAYCRRMIEVFGEQSLCLAKTHAKWVCIQNDGWSICIRSSMNLNRNRRWEQFDIDDDAEICGLFIGFAEEVAAISGAGVAGLLLSDTTDAYNEIVAAEARMRDEEAARDSWSELGASKAMAAARAKM